MTKPDKGFRLFKSEWNLGVLINYLPRCLRYMKIWNLFAKKRFRHIFIFYFIVSNNTLKIILLRIVFLLFVTYTDAIFIKSTLSPKLFSLKTRKTPGPYHQRNKNNFGMLHRT